MVHTQSRKKPYEPQDLFEIVADTVVKIQTEDGSGSGVIIDPQGVITTNHHVIGDCSHVVVRLKDGTQLNGEVWRSYRDADLAFIKVSLKKSSSFIFSLTSTQSTGLSCNRSPKVGETIFAVGHPLGLEHTLTRGIVSSAERDIQGAKYIQIDASINPGNSGGALYSAYAELLGINTMGFTDFQGLNFAIPATIIWQKYKELLDERNEGFVNYCNVCGNTSKDDKYCTSCGASIQKPEVQASYKNVEAKLTANELTQVCASCGTPAAEGQKYCNVCGSQIQ
jgi:serine protease Do